MFLVGLILTIVGAVMKPEGAEATHLVVQPMYPPAVQPLQPVYTALPTEPSQLAIQQTRPMERFCPVCGTHYAAGTQFCSKDATPLKDIA